MPYMTLQYILFTESTQGQAAHRSRPYPWRTPFSFYFPAFLEDTPLFLAIWVSIFARSGLIHVNVISGFLNSGNALNTHLWIFFTFLH